MAFNGKMIANLSTAFTLTAFAGLTTALYATLPDAKHLRDHAAAASAASETPPPTSGLETIRSRPVPVTDLRLTEEPSGYQLTVARKPPRPEPMEQPVPPSTWDGTPTRGGGQPTTENGKAAPVTPPKPQPSGPKPEPVEEDVSHGAPVAPPPADAAAPPPKDEWSPDEIASALRECIKLLGPIAAEIEPIDPVKKDKCGSAAPVLLKSVGQKDKVDFSPPAEVNCRLAAGLAEWVDKTLQPAAKDVLASRVVRITGASGYSCRNRYGLANGPLSEHAFANAVDVPGFVLADGRSIKVAGTWGPTARDLKAEAEAIAAAEKQAASGEKTAAKDEAEGAKPDAAAKNEPKKDAGKTRILASLKGVAVQKLGAEAAPRPVAGQPPPAEREKLSAEARFLRKVEAGACETFGTVLGPEANEAHRDHFHLDMKPRRQKAYCQ